MPRPARLKGVTLIELMVVLVIVAITTVLAGPSFTDSLVRARLKEKVGAVIDVIEFAKSEGLKRSSVTTDITPAGGGSGWRITASVKQGTAVVEARSAEQGASTVTLSAPAAASTFALSFRGIATGYVSSSACSNADQCLELASSDGKYRVRVGITTVGQTLVCTAGAAMGGYAAC